MKRNLMTLCVMIVAMMFVALALPALAAEITTPNDKTMIADNQVATDQPTVNSDSSANTDQTAAKEKLKHNIKIICTGAAYGLVIGGILGVGIPSVIHKPGR